MTKFFDKCFDKNHNTIWIFWRFLHGNVCRHLGGVYYFTDAWKKFVVVVCISCAFSALMLLVGLQEEHPARKN